MSGVDAAAVERLLAEHQRKLTEVGECICGEWPDRGVTDWPAHVAAALAPLLPQAQPDDEAVRAWRPEDGDTRCQDCGHANLPWFTDNSLWNEVMGGSAYEGDPGGYLCSRCFAVRADAIFPRIVWRFIPQWNGRAEAMDWPTADRVTQGVTP